MTSEREKSFAAAAPFAVWIALMSLLPATAAGYAARTAATVVTGLAALFWWRRTIGAWACPRGRDLLVGFIGGLVVAVIWILPEVSEWYRTWLCWPVGSLPEVADGPSPYEPKVCGWGLTLVRLFGSAFVIAPVEEVFFRSFLYRRLQNADWTTVPLSRFDLSAFLWMVFLFALEHDRLAVGAFAGAAYGLLTLRHGLAAAICAHVTTNLALALYVIARGVWAFW